DRDIEPGFGASAEEENGEQAEGLEHVGDEHGRLAPDAIRYPAPEDAPTTVGETAQGQRRSDGGGLEMEIAGNLRGLDGDHGATHVDHDKGDEKEIEVRCAQHLNAVELLRVAPY